jgi:hypothetical protein
VKETKSVIATGVRRSFSLYLQPAIAALIAHLYSTCPAIAATINTNGAVYLFVK